MSTQTQNPSPSRTASAAEPEHRSNPPSEPAPSNSEATTTTASQPTRKPLLALPESTGGSSSPNFTLDLSSGSDSIKLDHLGPMVVGRDGTLARVANWDSMTEGERGLTLKLLGKRNKERLDVLRAENGEGKKGV